MPWVVVEEGGQYCVYREGADGEPTGRSRGCYRTRGEARRRRAALYAAEARAGGEGKSTGFKSLGDAGWMGWFSNIFWDRDVQPDAPKGERFTLEALKEYTDWANSDPMHLPDLWFWHLSSVKLGRARWVEVVGPFAVAGGEWDGTNAARKARAYIEDTDQDWAMSHGFGYEPEDRVEGEYRRFRTHEVTVLPREHAANPVTFFGGTEMAKKGVVEELRGTLQAMLGISSDEASDIIDEARKGEGALGSEVKHKDTDDAAESVLDDDEEVSDDDLALAAAEVLIALGDEQEKNARLEGELAATKQALADLEGKLAKRIKALEDNQADTLGVLPRAIADAYRRASKHGEPVDGDEAAEDVAAMKAAMRNEPDWDTDPLGAHLSEWARAALGE